MDEKPVAEACAPGDSVPIDVFQYSWGLDCRSIGARLLEFLRFAGNYFRLVNNDAIFYELEKCQALHEAAQFLTRLTDRFPF